MADKKLKTMDDLLDRKGPSIAQLKRGDVVGGKVVHVTNREILVDVGAKAEGVVPQAEAKGADLKIGDSVFVYVITPEDRRGQLLLSLSKAETVKNWTDLDEASKNNTLLEAVVTGHNKGGLIVDVKGLVGFIPFSHLNTAPDLSMESNELQSYLDKIRNEKIKVRLIELDREQNRIILSEKEAALETNLKKKQKALSAFKEGQVVEGEISAVMPYGLMLKVGVSEGLIPLEELGWDKEENEELLAGYEVGTKLNAKIIEVDQVMGKISLSLKQTTQDPWLVLADSYHVGDEVKVKVEKITSYGVFAKLNEVDGMVTLSSFPTDLDVSVGQEIKVKIDKLEVPKHQLDFSYVS